MLDVLIALTPAVIVGIFQFGFSALLLCVIGVLGAELFEFFVMRVLRKKKEFVPDGSAAVTGLLLALNVSSALPWYLLLIGIVVAIGIGKHVFGGLGANPFNPALVGRAFLIISFPVQMTTWIQAGAWKAESLVSAATPLGILKENGFEQASSGFSNLQLFLGNSGGCIGEVSAIALLIGFAYLVVRKRANPVTPIAYIGTAMILSTIFFLVNPEQFGSPLFHLLSGGLLLGALFMATDMVTSPATIKGAMLFGVGCGAITMLIRFAGGTPEGVMFSILIMNAFKPLIDRISHPKPFGLQKKEAK